MSIFMCFGDAAADGFLDFTSRDILTGDPVMTYLKIWGGGVPDTLYDSTAINGTYFGQLPEGDDYVTEARHDPEYYPDTTVFNITENETTYVNALMEPFIRVVFVMRIGNPDVAGYRYFYANGTWDEYGRYNSEISEANFVRLNDNGVPPDVQARDGYFSGQTDLVIDFVHEYQWAVFSEMRNPAGSFLQFGDSFTLHGHNPYYPDTLHLNPSGNDPNWGISVYRPGYPEVDLLQDGARWWTWMQCERGSTYPFIFRTMHSDFSNYGEGGVGGDTVYFFSPIDHYFVLTFYDNSDLYGIDINHPTPYFASYPDSMYFNIDYDSSAVDTVRIYNFGDALMTYNVQVMVDSIPNRIDGQFSNPDGYGYIWTDSDKSGDLNYYWLDIENDGILVEGLEDDNYAGPFYIGFPFRYYGQYHDSFYVSSNGYISLGEGSSLPNGYFLPSQYAPPNIIAPYWDDYNFNVGGRVYYKSTNDSLIVSFIDLVRSDGGYPYIFQVILTAGNDITFQFDALVPPRARAVTGMQNSSGEYGTTVCYRNNYIHNTMVVKLLPTWISMANYSGYLGSGRFNYIPLTVRGDIFPAGIYDARLLVTSSDPDTLRNNVTIPVRMQHIGTGIDDGYSDNINLPGRIELYPNYPNPFNPSTNLRFYLPSASMVKIEVFNILGRKVAVLLDNEPITAGEHSVTWDGTTSDGKRAASGIYFCTLKTDSEKLTRKMLLIK